jgi:ASC-1-like (ASCH) protein
MDTSRNSYWQSSVVYYRCGPRVLARLQTGQTRATLNGDTGMVKTKDFKELVQSLVKTDKTFAEALLREGIDAVESGDIDTGKTIMRVIKIDNLV